MKKLLITLVLISLSFTPIMANNFTTSMRPNPITIEPGQEFTVNINVTNMSGIVAIKNNFSYDSTKLQLVQSEFDYNGFDVKIGSRLVVNFKTPRNGSFTAAQIRFRPRAGFSVGQSTTISFTGVSGTNGTTDFSGTSSNTTVTMVPARSSNNFLSSLSVSNANLNFSKTTLNYVLDVENSVTSVNISGTAEDSAARVVGLGTYALNVYENFFDVVVTAENGSRRTYTLNIRRKDEQGNPVFVSSSTDIDNITLSACDINFSNLVDSYRCVVHNDINQTSISVSSKDTTLKIEAPKEANLFDGSNVIEVRVIAQNNDVRVITIEVIRSTDIFVVSQDQALTILENISIPYLGISIQDEEELSEQILTKAFNLDIRLLIVSGKQSILLTVLAPIDTPLRISFQDTSKVDLSVFNYPIGQIVGLSAPLPLDIRGTWWIEAELSDYELNVYDIANMENPLPYKVMTGLLVVDDLTRTLLITPANLSATVNPWIVNGGFSLIGLVLGLIISFIFKKRT